MDTLKQVKESVLDAAKEAGQTVVSVAKDAQERAIEAKDRVVELADRAIEKIRSLGSQEDVFKVLKEDHKLVAGYFDHIEELKAGGGSLTLREGLCEGLFSQLQYELLTHAQVEEKLFYPAVKELDAPLIHEALEAHAEIKQLLDELTRERDPDVWLAKLSELRQKVEIHVGQEEGAIFSAACKGLSEEELQSLGARLQAEKLALSQEPKRTRSTTEKTSKGATRRGSHRKHNHHRGTSGWAGR